MKEDTYSVLYQLWHLLLCLLHPALHEIDMYGMIVDCIQIRKHADCRFAGTTALHSSRATVTLDCTLRMTSNFGP